MMRTTSSIVIVLSIVLFSFRVVSANGSLENDLNANEVPKKQSGTEQNENGFRRFLSNLPGTRLGRVSNGNTREDIEALRQALQNAPDSINWQQFTPPPVTDPNCYVEVQVTQRMPGKCTKLGGKIPACRSQDLLTIDYNSCA